MYAKKDNMESGKADHHYVETDPTGRYGRFGDILGKGATKTVYKAIDEFLGIEVAWNQVKLNMALCKPDDLQRLYSEVHLLSTLKHQCIIQFYTSWIDVDDKTFNFITEMFSSGTLREYRKKYKQVGIHAIKSWARQILQGLVYLHGHDPPVIHRDLKCDNIFVNGHLGQVKIGDLGLAAILRGSQSAHSVIGTPEFMAPELYEEEYNELVDVYSFGMCVLEMLTSEYPYSECANPAQIYKKVTLGKLPAAFFRIEDVEAQKFIGKCLLSAAKRPSANELLLDSFLVSDDAFSITKFGTQKPLLNESKMEELQLNDDSPRTEMTITGKLNRENDTIFLKVQIADKEGSVRNVYFPFDISTDTPIDVAMEMVKELEISDWEPFEIANMIEESISGLAANAEEMTNGYYWPHDDVLDDASSRCSSQGTYSNMNYFSVDDQEHNLASTRKDKHLFTKSHKCTRSFLGEEPSTGLSMRRKNKTIMDYRRLTRNRSLIDVHSQLLHRSLTEEVHKRWLSKTVGAVENIGFQTPSQVPQNVLQPICDDVGVKSSRSGKE